MRLFTIGFTQKSAEEFFSSLQRAGVRRIVDVRLNNSSQLAGFAKARDLPYLLNATGGIEYVHVPEFAPTQEILDAYKKNKGAWDVYVASFERLIDERHMTSIAAQTLRDGDCLLCSEHTPDQCHRRLITDRIRAQNPEVEVTHL